MFALAALWAALATWLMLIGSVVAIRVGADASVFDVTGWIALGFATSALVLGVVGVSLIPARGEPIVAIMALVLVLSLATYAGSLFAFGWGIGFGD